MIDLKEKTRSSEGSPTPATGLKISVQALRELAEWIGAGKLPELIPTHQERSLRTALALVEAGRTLLFDHSLEDLSVEMICQHAGTTVGAFYGRFENKHAFFVTMQRIQIIRAEVVQADLIRRHESGDATLETLCEEMVTLAVRRFRENLGVLRASLQHTREGMWEPFKASGDRYRAALSDRLSRHLVHIPPAQRDLRIRFAYQALAGTLVHAALNNPGPLALEDDMLITELVRMVHEYLRAGA